ncbi:MAG: hypothetical protein A4S09_02990 [Proteobacteria bacterium SG_bin7]|nr:MAG: hypothetical protein A4S09_02990 [Proteobacteria bacterium SG_bin7]
MKTLNLILSLSLLFSIQAGAETLEEKADLLAGGFFEPGVESKVNTDAIIKEYINSGVFAPGSCNGQRLEKRFQYKEGLDESAIEIEDTLRENLNTLKGKVKTVKSIRPVYEGSEFLGWTINFCKNEA